MEDREIPWKKIIDNMGMAMFVLERSGEMIFCNKLFKEILGPKSNFYESNFAAMVEEGRLDHSITQMVFKTKKEITMANTIRRANGETYRILGTTTPLLDENGEVEYVISVGMPLDRLRDEYVNAWLEDNARRTGMELHNQLSITQPLLYQSKSMEKVMDLAKRVARVDAAICISGESGTGKGTIARYIHRISDRCDKELVEVSCAAVPETLLESELFGYEKGAFTGALHSGKPGLMEMADKGTLFLDEIDSLPLSLQGKLLKALEDKQVQRIGSLKPKDVDFRLITATNADLLDAVDSGRFRKDLYFRICVLPLHIPPLRERPEDILLLSKYFMNQFSRKYNVPKVLTPEGYQKLLDNDWPGNVRELKNVIQRMIIMSDASLVELVDPLPVRKLKPGDKEFSLKAILEAYEKQLLEQVLHQHGLNEAARILGIDPSTLTRKRKKLGI